MDLEVPLDNFMFSSISLSLPISSYHSPPLLLLTDLGTNIIDGFHRMFPGKLDI